MSSVIEDLMEAINGESNAKRKYEFFAQKAEEENYPEIAHVFRAVAFAESIHIKNHLKALNILAKNVVEPDEFVKVDEDELKRKMATTLINLKDAVEGELYETKKMYKKFAKNARKNEEDVAELSFSLARKAEKVHAEIFSSFIKKIEKTQKMERQKIYVCQICGNVEFKKPLSCPVCDHSERFFQEIE